MDRNERQLTVEAETLAERVLYLEDQLANAKSVATNWQDLYMKEKKASTHWRKQTFKRRGLTFSLALATLIGIPTAFLLGGWLI